MSRPQSILIYYDGSAEAKCALTRTGELGWSSSGEIHVLAVADTATAMVSSAGMLSDIAYGNIVGEAWLTLDEALDHLIAQGTTARGYVSYGRVVDCIAHRAELVAADVIVIGYGNRRGRARWWWRSDPTLDELVERAAGRAVMAVPTR